MLQRTDSLKAFTSIAPKVTSNAEKNANKYNDNKPDVEEQPLKQNQIKSDQWGMQSSIVKKSLPNITKATNNAEKNANKYKDNKPEAEAYSNDEIKNAGIRQKDLKKISKERILTQEEQDELDKLTDMLKKIQPASKKYKKESKPKLPQNRQIIKDILNQLKYNGTDKLINTAISQFINDSISNIKFSNKTFKNQDFKKAFSDELNHIFSSAFKETDLKDDSEKWGNFFNGKLKTINTTPLNSKDKEQNEKINEENNKNFEYNLKILILAKKLANVAKESNNNRFYYFDQNAAQKTFNDIERQLNFEDCDENTTDKSKVNQLQGLINTFLANYNPNLKTELFKNCEKFDIKDDNGTSVGIAYNIERLNKDKEHDDLQIKRLQNLAAPKWCTCHAYNCEDHLSNANSFLFIPNEGNRILRIQGHVNGDIIFINSVTGIENEPNGDGDCWISRQDDLDHLWTFISTMEQNGYNIQAKNDIFNMKEIASLEERNRIINRFPPFSNLLNKVKNVNDINEIMQILNAYIRIQNGSLKIRNCNTEERNNLIEALYSTNFFSELNINKIPYNISFKDQEQIDLNTITDYSKIITLTNVHYFNCLNLKELSKTIQQFNSSSIPIVFNAPNLTNAKNIHLTNIESITLPNLIECDSLTLGDTNSYTGHSPTLPNITLEKLEKVNEKFSVLNPQKLDLPSLKSIETFRLEIDEDKLNNFMFNAPNLNNIGTLKIVVTRSKDIMQILKKLAPIIKLAKNTTISMCGDKEYVHEEIQNLLQEIEIEQ